MGRNAEDSKWRSTPQEARHRKVIGFTLSSDANERLDKIAKARGLPRSQVVEALIMGAPIREAK